MNLERGRITVVGRRATKSSLSLARQGSERGFKGSSPSAARASTKREFRAISQSNHQKERKGDEKLNQIEKNSESQSQPTQIAYSEADAELFPKSPSPEGKI
jgi:hypothetical protein